MTSPTLSRPLSLASQANKDGTRTLPWPISTSLYAEVCREKRRKEPRKKIAALWSWRSS